MEEVVGKLWDKWLTKQVSTDFPESQFNLADIQSQLQVFYRSLGGDKTKILEACEPRSVNVERSIMQKVAGSHQRFYLSWQDENSLRLPPNIAIFPDASLNEFLYFWLVALAAYMPTMQHWLLDNQQATKQILARYPGLKKQYQQLVNGYLLSRGNPDDMAPLTGQNERALQQALQGDVIVSTITATTFQPSPVALWLYPAPANSRQAANAIAPPTTKRSPAKNKEIKELPQRKKAQYVDEKKATDGLMIFQAEALSTWTEQISLDRSQSDDEDDAVDEIAKDMEVINLSRQRKASAAGIKFNLDLPAEENDDLYLGEGIQLPEWHYKKNQLVANVCQLQTLIADEVTPVELSSEQGNLAREVQNFLSMLAISSSAKKAQINGAELDVDAWIDHYTRPVKDSSEQRFYIDNQHKYRDISCLLLADLSLSTESYINNEQQVIDTIREALIIFSEAMHTLADPFAIYGFSSIRSNQIRYHILKNFNMRYDKHVRGRIARIEPGFYTRMGAAIRQSSQILTKQQTKDKLLLIISDGKPNDLDQYEGRYGIEDTRQAVLEAKKMGIEPFCITIDKKGNDYLPYLFGQFGFTIVKDPALLAKALPKIYAQLTLNKER
ncbi:VWA domain-containing protein [Colwellia sp. KU-HH00111]|uniref:nitric oxide reductase activation protein NorD n=1 Tax=Colwellia sp. KU-HH00111 TaxID=3127652 RepID=UPI0031039638